MNLARARTVAAQWVRRHAPDLPGYRGAYFSGSTVSMPDDATLPAVSDVDVMVVVAGGAPPKLGKFRHQGVLLEVSYLPWELFGSAEEVLGSYHLAGSFRTDTVIDDPTGRLGTLRAEVSRHFSEPSWVRRRCADASDRIKRGLAAVAPAAPYHEQVTAWLFPTGVSCHVILAGSQELIDRGFHREAVFWIAATFARCHTILATDAPELHRAYRPGFQAVTRDLRIADPPAIAERAEGVRRFLPAVQALAETIMRR